MPCRVPQSGGVRSDEPFPPAGRAAAGPATSRAGGAGMTIGAGLSCFGKAGRGAFSRSATGAGAGVGSGRETAAEAGRDGATGAAAAAVAAFATAGGAASGTETGFRGASAGVAIFAGLAGGATGAFCWSKSSGFVECSSCAGAAAGPPVALALPSNAGFADGAGARATTLGIAPSVINNSVGAEAAGASSVRKFAIRSTAFLDRGANIAALSARVAARAKRRRSAVSAAAAPVESNCAAIQIFSGVTRPGSTSKRSWRSAFSFSISLRKSCQNSSERCGGS
jgi:F-box protein 11